VTQKTRHQTLVHIDRFSNFFTDGIKSKFATNLYLNIQSRLKHVSTLPCEICTSDEWCHSEICIVINDKSQSSIAKHLRSDEIGLLHYTFITQSAVKQFLKLVNIWRSYRQNGDCFMRLIRIALLSSKMLISPDKLNNLCIMDKNCYYSLLC